MPYQRKWWSGHDLYGLRPQECRFRESCYQEFPYIDLSAEDEESLQLSYWKSLYPEKIKKVQCEVEKVCESLEYDSSPMYDEYPDKIYLRKLCSDVYARLMEEEGFEDQDELPQELFDTALTGEYTQTDSSAAERQYDPRPGGPHMPKPKPPRPQPPKNSWLRDIIEVLMYQEMHKRRCERGKCRRKWY